jgi:hypothetical protein
VRDFGEAFALCIERNRTGIQSIAKLTPSLVFKLASLRIGNA